MGRVEAVWLFFAALFLDDVLCFVCLLRVAVLLHLAWWSGLSAVGVGLEYILKPASRVFARICY